MTRNGLLVVLDWPMSCRLLSMQRRLIFRRLFVGLCVVAHLSATTGFALPELKAADPSDKPFPCQQHRCGCHSADQCWRSCCCMTQEEKLAWARKNGVRPPQFVVEAAAREKLTAAQSLKGCCSQQAVEPSSGKCCSSRKKTSCCDQIHQPADHLAGESKAQSSIGWVLGIHALQCQGLATLWVSTGAVIAPPPVVEAPQDCSPPQWCDGSADSQWTAISMRPDIPPPRFA